MNWWRSKTYWEKVDWEKAKIFLSSRYEKIIGFVEKFIAENPDWSVYCKNVVSGISATIEQSRRTGQTENPGGRISIDLEFWMRDEVRPRRQVSVSSSRRCVSLTSEEIAAVAAFVGKILESTENLKVSFSHFGHYVGGMLSYELKIKSYKPFKP